METNHDPEYQRLDTTPTRSTKNSGESWTAALKQQPAPATTSKKKKRHNHRGGKKKRSRGQTFPAETENSSSKLEIPESVLVDNVQNAVRESFFRVQGITRRSTSAEIEGLIDHRDQSSFRPRRASAMGQSAFGVPLYENSTSYRMQQNAFGTIGSGNNSLNEDERIPLVSTRNGAAMGYGMYGMEQPARSRKNSHLRHSSHSSTNSKRRQTIDKSSPVLEPHLEEYNVNYPPSIPDSPTQKPSQTITFSDILVRDEIGPTRASTGSNLDEISDHAINDNLIENSPRRCMGYEHRKNNPLHVDEDACFSVEGMSDMGEEYMQRENDILRRSNGARRRRGKWPDLSALEEWSRLEKEGKNEERRVKKITEPQLIGGRLRPIHRSWHRAEDDAPYRFTYFNEQLQSTIHSQTISELLQPGGVFRELFNPDPPELSDSSESGSDFEVSRNNSVTCDYSRLQDELGVSPLTSVLPPPAQPDQKTHSWLKESLSGTDWARNYKENSGTSSPAGTKVPLEPIKENSPKPKLEKPKRYGNRPTWWLDVLSPTDDEMKVLSKAFGIHPLTAEDILLQEAREKVELFHNYYFVNYRSFEQDTNNKDFLEPVNMYVIVFREGVISFHFSLTPHPANVRRRIRQLKDYLILSSDWISYAIIDDITDVFAPLIQSIEDEVDDIDDAILMLHAPLSESKSKKGDEKGSESGDATFVESGGDMLRRVGDCRKKVMSLYRLLGNKADVIKGFAKRCNEHWEIAPRSEIGLYLGDIQDHIVTMTGNLSHYEKILARSHGNYLAQINIRMNERQEQTADVLGKLTVLGTIVLPMNIITGLWGMNVWVPGQQAEGDLTWFCCLSAGLIFFGLSCFMIAKILYRIV
ncbi:unnamed protein product [Blumeria hordei]|uniref:Uncharacterized protein n=1 Tax=Blumeria hordei TaxID=2867405 RepID=A0A383UTV5_BLUHO|nr:unnamed protein product [Blumeria hordei]